MDVTVCIPVYNEEDYIFDTVSEIMARMGKISFVDEYEILIADGGSDDSTKDIILNKIEDERVCLLEFESRMYKGESIEAAFEHSQHEVFVFIDGDGSVNPSFLLEMLESLRNHDIVVGFKQSVESNRSRSRKLATKTLNLILKTVFNSEIKDHQCGFKGFQRSEVRDIFDKTESRGWFWDAEFLIRAQKEGADIKQIPVEWMPKGGSKVNLIQDTSLFLIKIIFLKTTIGINRIKQHL